MQPVGTFEEPVTLLLDIISSEILDRKDYALFQLSRKLAENDKQGYH